MIEWHQLRVGQGFDIHPLVQGAALILGGVPIPFYKKSQGDSDADCLTHAIIDALLGACAQGTIGDLFPPTTRPDQTEKMCSLAVLAALGQKLITAHVHIINIDSTVIIEELRLAPYIQPVCSSLAHALCIDSKRVSVKPKTHDRIGSLGQGIAVACYANVLLFHAEDPC